MIKLYDLPFQNRHNIVLLPDGDSKYIFDKEHSFTINRWNFYDFVKRNNRYIVVCHSSSGVWDYSLEWLYDTIIDDYVLSDRGYGAPFSEATVVYSVKSLNDVIDFINKYDVKSILNKEF